jgi:hypothetical protein
MATRIYLLLIKILAGLIGPTKVNPHFINHSFGKIVTNLTKFYVANPLVLWHASQDMQNLETS